MYTSLLLALSAGNVALAQALDKPVGASPANPSSVGDFDLVGCVSDKSGISASFKMVVSTAEMSLNMCAASCPSKYFAVNGESCFCGDDIKEGEEAEAGTCSMPCPGNDQESCGGMGGNAAAASTTPAADASAEATPEATPEAADEEAPAAAGAASGGALEARGNMHYTLYCRAAEPKVETVTKTITACPVEVTDCPAHHKTVQVVTETICPSTEWHKKKIVCYGDHCAPEQPCVGPQCQRERVICTGDYCWTEICDVTDPHWNKLVICDGEQCKWSETKPEDCNTKIVCYEGKCVREECIGDECKKNLVCNGEECHYVKCVGDLCNKTVICKPNEQCYIAPQPNGGPKGPTNGMPNNNGKPMPNNNDNGKPNNNGNDNGKPMPNGNDNGKPMPNGNDNGKPMPNGNDNGKPNGNNGGPGGPGGPNGESCPGGPGCPAITKIVVPVKPNGTGTGVIVKPTQPPMVAGAERAGFSIAALVGAAFLL